MHSLVGKIQLTISFTFCLFSEISKLSCCKAALVLLVCGVGKATMVRPVICAWALLILSLS